MKRVFCHSIFSILCRIFAIMDKAYACNSENWIEVLIHECNEEVKAEARWPTILLQSPARQSVWSICSILGVCGKGVPGSACRLMERYLSRHIRNFLNENRTSEEWARYKELITSQFFLLLVSCAQLAAKMSDLQTALNASSVRSALLQHGIDHTTAEIVTMEFNVFSLLDYRIPIWTSLETAECLADHVGLREPQLIKALELIINATEYRRDILELNMKNWSAHNRPANVSPPTGSGMRLTLLNLHVCAAGVVATARYMKHPATHACAARLAQQLRMELCFLRAMAHVILYSIVSDSQYVPALKKRRFV